ncbi:retrovirus-related pol polyprotein from transposon TNT 1-94 [Tanacetum coccineum]|uniref:Retrovirus-related pol polyprotein from transposon TNT 1-94 n=1 Tax=Tanacetum coccineum TaxID=301880 RepID=A0ABQ5G9Y0_9ASTR
MRMEQYLTHTNYTLWEVIMNGDAPAITSANTEAPIEVSWNQGCKDLMESNQGHVWRQQRIKENAENHSEAEDANLKLLRILPSAWNNIALIMRNKVDLDELSMDDLFNNLKVYEAEIKSQSSSSSNSQNVSFVSSYDTSSTNDAFNTAHDVPAARSKGQASSSTYAVDVMFSFFVNQSNSPHLDKKIWSRLILMILKRWISNGSQMNENELHDCHRNKSEVFESASDSSVNEIEEENNQVNDWFKENDSVYKTNVSETISNVPRIESTASKSSKDSLEQPKDVRPSAPIIEEWESDNDDDFKTTRVNNVTTAGSKAVVNTAMGNGENAVKSSACWIWRPTGNVINHTSKDSGSYMLKRFDYVDLQGRLNGCSRHMTGNKSFLTDYQEVDGGFVAFAGSPKGGKITRKRFSWVFFLATKDETSGILKTFITGIENQINHKVKIIRCDNRTEFKNNDMNQFCGMKGIKREFSVAKTLKQNGVAERKNRTLIEAARTMLADSLVPTTFWAKAVSTACYIQNRVLVTKPHNKTPYELLHGRPPSISFMRPFGCPVTILNTLDPLGKFDEKADKGFFIGYSINSKAFGSSKDAVANDASKKTIEEPAHEGERNGYANNINRDSTVSPSVSIAGQNFTNVNDLPTNPLILDFEDTGIFSGAYDDEDVGADADLNNLEITMNVSPIPITRIHKDHPKDQIIRDINSATQTRRMTKITKEHAMVKPKKVIQVLTDPSWIEAMPEELLQFKIQKVWTVVDLPKGKRAIGTKWVYRNKKDERGIIVRKKARLVAQGYTQEEGIDYDKVFASVARIEAIRLFLAYASFIGFIMYQMDVKSAFLYGTIEDEVYVCQPPGFEDLQFPDKTLFIKKDKGDILLVHVYVDDIIFGSTKNSLYFEFNQMMHKRFQMSSMGELTFFLGLQVMQKDDGVFISQDKYVTDILKKFDFVTVKTTSTLIETNKALLRDEEAEDVDVHLYRSMIGSLMYLTASRPDIMFVVYACARDSPFDLEAFSKSDYAGASLDRKSTTGDCQFLGKRDSYEKKLIQVIKIHIDHNVADETVYKEWEDRMERATTPTSSLEAEQDSGSGPRCQDTILGGAEDQIRFEAASKQSNDPPLSRVNTLGSGDDSMKLKELMELFPTAVRFNFMLPVQVNVVEDGKVKVVSEASIRRHLKLEDSDGISTLPTSEIFKQLALIGSKKTAWEQFSSNIATAIICLATNRTFNFSKLIFDAMVKNLDSKTNFLMYPRFIQIFLNKHKGLLLPHKRLYIAPTLTQKLFSNMKRAFNGYTGVDTPLFQTMLVQGQILQGKGSKIPVESHHIPISGPSTSQPPTSLPSMQTTHVAEEAATMPHDSHLLRVYSLRSDKGGMTLNELTVLCTTLSKKVETLESDLKQTKLTYGAAYTKLIIEVPQPSSPTRTHVADKVVSTSVDVRHGRAATTVSSLDVGQGSGNIDNTLTMPYDSPLLRVHTLGSDEGIMQHNELMDLVTKLLDRVVSLETDLQQTKKVYGATYTKLIKKVKRLEDKLNKSRRKRKLIRELLCTANVLVNIVGAEISTASPKVKTAGVSVDDVATEGLMYIRRSAAKRKDKEALRLQEQFDEEERQRIASVHEEASTFKPEEWDNIQAQIEADEELAHRLQAQERERYSEADKAKLLVELINERKRQFAQQRAQQRRNMPLTQAQQRSYMCNYIKHMGSHTLQQLRGYSFDEIKVLFEATVKRVNTFTPMESDDTVPKVVAGSSKRSAEEELGEESSKRQKIGEGSEPAEE